MSFAGLRVNAARLRADIEALSRIGLREDHGIFRMAFSDDDMQARDWFRGLVEDSDLEFFRDGAANLFARLNWNDQIPSVMTGSHLDTVPGAGHLDGALGVLCGLEALRTLRESGIPLQRPLEAVSFTDEEGRFGGLFGSQAVAGRVTPEYLRNANDLEGTNLVTAMSERGLDATDAITAKRARGSIHAYVELHIEQGPVLDRKGLAIGIVEAITGLFKWEISLHGTVNHAGTTPMDMREDAFQGLVEFAARIDGILSKHGGPQSTATIGRVELKPGAANVIPGLAVFSLDVRDTNTDTLNVLAETFRGTLSAIAAERRLGLDVKVLSQIAPVQCAANVVEAIDRAVKASESSAIRMRSGAAHDAQIIAGVAPTGMIFVPSKDGRSHSIVESTDWKDIEAGANILLNTLRQLAS